MLFRSKDYLVKASVGHIRDLESSKLSIDVNNDFKPTYVVSKDKKQVVSDLKNCVKKCSDVILAADEDREGEAIAWHVREFLEEKKLLKDKKIHPASLSDNEDIYMNLSDLDLENVN